MSQITLEYVEQLSGQLSTEDQHTLSEHLKAKLSNGSTMADEMRKPRDLYGLWRSAIPEELDVDIALHEIRHEWERNI